MDEEEIKNKSDGEYLARKHRKKTDANKVRKEQLEQKRSTREIKAKELLERVKAEKEEREAELNQPCCIVYFVDDLGRITASAYLNSPEEAPNHAPAFGSKLKAYEAGYALSDLQAMVEPVLERPVLSKINKIFQTIEVNSFHSPVLIASGIRKNIETLDHLLTSFKTENYQEHPISPTVPYQ